MYCFILPNLQAQRFLTFSIKHLYPNTWNYRPAVSPLWYFPFSHTPLHVISSTSNTFTFSLSLPGSVPLTVWCRYWHLNANTVNSSPGKSKFLPKDLTIETLFYLFQEAFIQQLNARDVVIKQIWHHLIFLFTKTDVTTIWKHFTNINSESL